MAAVTVTFQPDQVSIEVPPDTTVLEAAAAAGLTLHTPCGGQGRCGKCAVRFLSGLVEPEAPERRFLTPEQLEEGWRLACSARVTCDAEILLPPGAVMVEHRIMVEGIGREIAIEPNVRKLAFKLPPATVEDARADLLRVLDALGAQAKPSARLQLLQSLPGALRGGDFQLTAAVIGDELVAVEPGDTAQQCYGVAVDVGTTTVVAYLCHLATGELVSVASDLNPQAHFGEDVISRLRIATTEADGLERLQQAVVRVINKLIGRAAKEAGVSPTEVYEVAAVGNTCMTHLLLGVPPAGLSALPFLPSFRRAQKARAADLGIFIHPEGSIYVAPNIGGFVGADTVGVILTSELDHGEGLRVAVDIGTNGEIVVAENGRLYACSTAAGPAFEGARISQGMRAATGAIDQVEIGDDVSYHVLGDAPPQGLCGSGLVDAVAGLVRQGLVDETGRMRPAEEVASAPRRLRERLLRRDDGLCFVIAAGDESAEGKPVCVTARDVRELQLAKGAIFTGITMLLAQLDHEPGQVEELLLAGAFGNYIRRESAVAIGLVPALPPERVRPIGNAAGMGARLMLCSVSLRRRAEEIGARVEHIELSQQEGFHDRFAEAMALRPLL